MQPSEANLWTERLLASGASLYQLPYWNEPLRVIHFRPKYLVYHEEDGIPAAFVSILELGVPGARIALAARGPVPLREQGRLPLPAFPELLRWSARRGHLFLRLTHDRADLLNEWATLPRSRREDPFPFYSEPREELLIAQDGSDDQVASRFQPVARRSLRKAGQVGYRIESDDAPEALSRVWPLFEGLSRRKNFRYRPLASFVDLLRYARPFGGARLFVAWLGDRPIQAILVVRDRLTAHYIIGALDTAMLGDCESPSVLLHWHAMRHFAALGTRYYDLGTRSGQVQIFKQKFRPIERYLPPPVTLVANPLRYRCWAGVALSEARRLWPRLKRLLGA